MTTTTATQLQHIATLWPDLTDALEVPVTPTWPPAGLRHYLQALEQYDATEAVAQRALERNPDQLGARPVPINLDIVDTMRTVEADLYETADQIAAANQHHVNTSHPHRWRYTGRRPGAIHTARWLAARADGVFWPGRALTEPQTRHLGHVAREALARVEAALDLAHGQRELSAEHRCQCGGRIIITGGAGDTPTARCRQCGAWWTERGIVAA